LIRAEKRISMTMTRCYCIVKTLPFPAQGLLVLGYLSVPEISKGL
jgi:hypothetical protein